jgi:AraC-like DNA-binding protein
MQSLGPDSQNRTPVQSLKFVTEGLPTRDAFDAWQTIMSEFYDVTTSPARQAAFAADMTTWNLGGTLLSQGTYTGQSFSRTSRRARKDGFDAYTLLIYRQGHWRADAGGRILESAAGRVNIVDFAQPLNSDVTTNDSISVAFPRDFLDAVLPPCGLHGLMLEGACGGLLSDFLLAVARRVPNLSAHEGPHVAAAIRDLLAACVQPSPKTAERARPQLDALALRRGQALIEANLHRPDWGAEQLRLALGVSRSALYRIFEPAGGVAQQIRTQRLERAHKMLAQAGKTLRVYQVAERCGFVSETHFSRAFRQAYGYTAREAVGLPSPPVRARPNASAGAPGSEAGFVAWIRGLRL